MSKKQSYEEVPGNSIQSAANYQRMLLAITEAIIRLSNSHRKNASMTDRLKGMSIRAPRDEGGDWFIVLRADIDGEAQVAFQSGETLEEALKGACNRYVYGQLKWKEDAYG